MATILPMALSNSSMNNAHLVSTECAGDPTLPAHLKEVYYETLQSFNDFTVTAVFAIGGVSRILTAIKTAQGIMSLAKEVLSTQQYH